MLDINRSDVVYSVAFHPDGMHLLSGSGDGIRQWRLADGQEVGKQSGMHLNAISVSTDGKWIVCGTTRGASVWDEKIQEKVVDVEGRNYVGAVDVSPDSTRFATGTYDQAASIWNIVTGERLVGPLQHDGYVVGVKFSPNGKRVATACGDSLIRIFDNHNGDQLIVIKANLEVLWLPVTPLAWSSNGEQIFAASGNNKIMAFSSSTGSQLAESQVHDNDSKVTSIALAANGKFLSTFVANSISFWDTSTLARINLPIEDSERLWSLALSTDCSYLAAGTSDGRIMTRNLTDIVPDLYGPFHVGIWAFTMLACRLRYTSYFLHFRHPFNKNMT